jgi:hypothetical protein
MIFEMMVLFDGSPTGTMATGVYTQADVDQYGSHRAYADHVIDAAKGHALDFGLPNQSAPPQGAPHVRVWARKPEEWTGMPRYTGDPIEEWHQ